MRTKEKYIRRCFQLAKLGFGNTYPNPMVGSVIVYNDKIIGEGFHEKYGEAHAEVNAIKSVAPKNQHLLKKSIIYVSLEPCSHFGKTPPCADLIIKNQIPKVVIACKDPFPKVAGGGIKKLEAAGIEVEVGVLNNEAEKLNSRFFTSILKKRPYIILKWAQTQNGFFAPKNGEQEWISNPLTKKLTHRWRTEEQAILVGTNTAIIDNPQLNSRLWEGENPIRVTIDRFNKIPSTYHLLNDKIPTLIFTETLPENKDYKNTQFHLLKKENDSIEQILRTLHQQNIQSLIVEGGAQLLHSFIEKNMWDEARIFIGNHFWEDGIIAPNLKKEPNLKREVGDNELWVFDNTESKKI